MDVPRETAYALACALQSKVDASACVSLPDQLISSITFLSVLLVETLVARRVVGVKGAF